MKTSTHRLTEDGVLIFPAVETFRDVLSLEMSVELFAHTRYLPA